MSEELWAVIDGRHVAMLYRDGRNLCFVYQDSWLKKSGACPLSFLETVMSMVKSA